MKKQTPNKARLAPAINHATLDDVTIGAPNEGATIGAALLAVLITSCISTGAFCSFAPSSTSPLKCLAKFEIGNGKIMGEVFHSHEIYKASSKQVHLSKVCESAGCTPEEVIFFDNQMNNCNAVVQMGVTTVFTGRSGVTKEIWEMALREFPTQGKILKM